ncbi:MAG: response regulator transcription factor [Bacteroidota bacterium]|nr:response regulator transcription factor [Bacteroidota bacterium]MDP4205642.1 response regulator transcription factor [Bacteroidota bacterium]
MNDGKYQIMLVDDHTLFRNGLRMLLNNFNNFKIVAEASNGKEFLELLDTTPVDVVLLDIAMPEMDGIEAAQLALKKYPNLKIITLSMYGEEDYYFKMVSAGVKGFLLKNSDITEVCNAIESVIEGGSFFSKELLFNLVSNLKSSSESHKLDTELSERELEILILICKGYSNQEIGEQLFISKRTVDKHRANILAKTNCKNTANLVVFAIKNKLVEF